MDSKTPGFGVRVSPRSKTFVANRGGTRKTLGHYPAISLQEARRRFFELKATTDTGSPQISFQQARSEYLAQDNRWKASSKKQITRLLMRHFHWDKPLDRITSNDVSTVIDAISAPKEATHALAYVKAFFSWCVPRYLKHSPCTGLHPSTRAVSRERLLSNDELAAIWRSAEQMGDYGRHVQLLITTGQRCNQILLLEDQWIRNDTITFPAPAMKNNRTHIIPLGKLTASLLEGRGHLTRFQILKKAELDRLSGVSGWTHHDIRRAFASGMASLGIGLPVIERLLAHRSGSFAGIVGIYQRYDFLIEMRAAIDLWETHLAALIAEPPK